MKSRKQAFERGPSTTRELIRECERLSNPETIFSLAELANLQYDAVQCLLRLGTQFDAIRGKVEELRFSPDTEPIWKFARTGDEVHIVIPFTWSKERGDEHITGCLNQLKDLLLAASARQKAITSGAQPSDPAYMERLKAIRAACRKYRSEPNYVEKVCLDLHNSRVPMPTRWLDAWGKIGIRFEAPDWFAAYQNKTARPKITKHISKSCKRTSHPA